MKGYYSRSGRRVAAESMPDATCVDNPIVGEIKINSLYSLWLSRHLPAAGEVKAWVPRAFKEFDYRRAIELVLPAIERDFATMTPVPSFARRVRRAA